MRKAHEHAYYCAKQKKLTADLMIKYRDYDAAIQPDDKQALNVGEPGTAASVLAKQRSTPRAIDPTRLERSSGQQNTTQQTCAPSIMTRAR